MEGYKVIKNFGDAEKGDVFTKVDDLNMWTLIKESHDDNCDYCSTMTFDTNTMEDLVEKDYVVWESDDVTCDECAECECCTKLNKLDDYITTLLNTYTKDYNDLMKEYNDGNVQQCVKVEAETVYHNLNKVLNSIKDLLNE